MTARFYLWSGVLGIALSVAAPRIAAQVPLTTLYTFTDGSDGAIPSYSKLIEKGGALYGAAQSGGNSSCPSGCGTIFKVAPPKKPGQAWKQTVLYSFQGGSDGNSPQVLVSGAGGLYNGMTYSGGANNAGTAFELAPPSAAGSPWTETPIYSFGAYAGDVTVPGSGIVGMVSSKAGTLYGTTAFGGANGYGGVFELAPPSAPGGTWTETVIYSFTSGDVAGGYASGGLLLGKNGAIYGAVEGGGAKGHGYGFVYELKRRSSGKWVETEIYDFEGSPSDGAYPITTLIEDSNGALYGTTYEGGAGCISGGFGAGCGTVFMLTPPTSTGATWTQHILYSFPAANGDGVAPAGSLFFGANGALFGTTSVGGAGSCSIYFAPGCGTIFELAPGAAGSPWTETLLYSFSGTADGAFPLVGLVSGENSELYGTTASGFGVGSSAYGYGTVFQVTP